MNRFSLSVSVALVVGCSGAPDPTSPVPGFHGPLANQALGGSTAVGHEQPLPALVNVVVSAESSRMATCGVSPLHAIASFADGSTEDVSAAAAWTSSAPAVAVVATQMAGTTLTGRSTGTVQVTARYGGATGSATFTLDPVVPARLAIDPPVVSVFAGQDIAYTATAVACDGTTTDVTTLALWETMNRGVASPMQDPGLEGIVHTRHEGASYVLGRYQSVSGMAEVVVTPAQLQWLEITPAEQLMPVGSRVQLGALGHYSDGTAQTLAGVTWDTSDRTVALISPDGLVHAMSPGHATVSLSYSGLFSATAFDVTP